HGGVQVTREGEVPAVGATAQPGVGAAVEHLLAGLLVGVGAHDRDRTLVVPGDLHLVGGRDHGSGLVGGDHDGRAAAAGIHDHAEHGQADDQQQGDQGAAHEGLVGQLGDDLATGDDGPGVPGLGEGTYPGGRLGVGAHAA